jgi:hypothetical protein
LRYGCLSIRWRESATFARSQESSYDPGHYHGGYMTDRRRSNSAVSDATRSAITRREILRIGGAVIPAGLILPAWLTASAQSASTYDFYISTSGSDSNPGTLAKPWAITSLMSSAQNGNNVANWNKTAGKRVGLLPGTYSVGPYMKPDSHTGALQLNGGTAGAPTFLGSSDASGVYSARTATITALNGGVPGGFSGFTYNGPILANTGNSNSGYFTLDGIVFTGYTYKGVRIGGGSSGDGPKNVQGVLVQNCEFTGQKQNSGQALDNMPSLWFDYCVGAVANNNYFHDNQGINPGGEEHLTAIVLWGCQGTVIKYNSVVNSGSIWGKEIANQGTTIAFNYIDGSMFTATAGMFGMEDFTGAPTSGLTQTSYIHNNVLLSSAFGIRLVGTLEYTYGWTTPIQVYNNTVVISSRATPYPAIWIYSASGGKIQCYNNIYSGAADGSGYGCFVTNGNGISIWDYNCYISTGMKWGILSSGGGTPNTYSTLASAQAAAGVSSLEAHSVATGDPLFTGSGTQATAYQLQSGSPAKNAGRTNGTSSGSPCDMGAWGNGATQIGCSFSASNTSNTTVPQAPILTIS